MLEDLASHNEIARLTNGLLLEAAAYDRFPTPVDDIVAAASLTEPEHSLLSNLILAQAPRYLRDAMAPLRRKVRALLDRKEREIHLDPTIDNDGQRRFKRCHEVSHDLYPWQSALGYADDDTTLAFTTRILFEQEANQGAAELLFQRERFHRAASDYAIGIASVIELAETFGTSIHSTFRRYVETHGHPVAGLVLEPSPASRAPLIYRRKEALQSRSWTKRFGPVVAWPLHLRAEPYSFINSAPHALTSATPPRTTFSLPDLSHAQQAVEVEIFSNTYRLFVLLWLPRRELLKRRRVLSLAKAPS
jgi:Zn-dependent peptidase ImmA (M78 family)